MSSTMKKTSDNSVASGSETEDREKEYYVEKIIAKRVKNRRIEYYLKWTGYNDEYNLWVPIKDLYCNDLIKEFEDNFNFADNKKTLKEIALRCNRKHSVSKSIATSGVSSKTGPSKTFKNVSPPKSKIDESDKEDAIDKSDKHDISDPKIDDGQQDTLSEGRENVDIPGNVYVGKVPEKILGVADVNEQIEVLIKWKNEPEANLIPSKIIRYIYPQMLIKYYEDNFIFCNTN